MHGVSHDFWWHVYTVWHMRARVSQYDNRMFSCCVRINHLLSRQDTLKPLHIVYISTHTQLALQWVYKRVLLFTGIGVYRLHWTSNTGMPASTCTNQLTNTVLELRGTRPPGAWKPEGFLFQTFCLFKTRLSTNWGYQNSQATFN